MAYKPIIAHTQETTLTPIKELVFIYKIPCKSHRGKTVL